MERKHDGRRRIGRLSLSLIAAGVVFLGGCASYKGFIYQPNPAISEKPLIPVQVAVLPFQDGTPEWNQDGSFCNMTKFPMILSLGEAFQDKDKMPPFIPPERWARDFAQELAASGAFSSVRYAEGGIDPGADLLVQGKVLRALLHNGILGTSYDYSAEFRAVRALDGAVLWEKTIARKHGASMSDPVELTKALWQSLFGEARDELVKALEVRRSELFGPKGAPAAPASGTEESVEDILNRINDQ